MFKELILKPVNRDLMKFIAKLVVDGIKGVPKKTLFKHRTTLYETIHEVSAFEHYYMILDWMDQCLNPTISASSIARARMEKIMADKIKSGN